MDNLEFKRNLIIGTAGHIDHGKTTLIKALTGHNTDTLAEEMRRGITINLGFTWFDLKSGMRAGIVDVPGHERFIKNMIAGAIGIDMALLVIAATEGVKPQTVEHLDILSSLGLSSGLIAMTKCDLADQMMIELVIDDIRESVKNTFLEDADIIQVDSVSGQGIDLLKDKIDSCANRVKYKNIYAPARLNIDRTFTKKGFGTVVTGTLIEGKIKVNDELTLYPQNIKVKIRNVQVHESDKDIALAGQRTALNLNGVKSSDIERGNVLAENGTMEETLIVDAKLRIFGHTKKEVKFWDRLRLYLGAREIFCRVVPLSSDSIVPGGEDFCQLRLEEAVYCKKDDKFVVRRYSPMETIGGGNVVDPHPNKHARMTEALLAELNLKESGNFDELIEDYIKSNFHKYPDLRSVRTYLAADELAVSNAIERLINSEAVFSINGMLLHFSCVDDIKNKAIQILSEFHQKNPLKKGLLKEELKSKLLIHIKLRQKDLDSILKIMEKDSLINFDGNTVSLHSFKVALTAEQVKIKEKLEKKLLESGLTPPPLSELTEGLKKHMEVLELLTPDTVIFLDKQTVIHLNYYNMSKNKLVEYLNEHNEITLAQFRDIIGTSRKYAQLLLENFDNIRLTIRIEDKRVLNRKY